MMRIHPAAKAIPEMSGEDFAALRDDIERNGLLAPIETLNGSILDGRHRHRACVDLQIAPKTIEVDLDGMSPAEYVWSLNGARRHLTASQKAAVALELLPEFEKEAKQRQGSREDIVQKIAPSEKGKARDKAAAVVGVNRQYVSDAKSIREKSPDAFERVKSGELSLTQAKRAIKDEAVSQRRQSNRRKVEKATSLDDLQQTFSTILIDPPWDWGDEGDVNQMGRAKPDYATMSIEDLAKLPVSLVSDVDCHLYCWVTNRSMPKVFGLLEDWGFRYVTLLTWPKTHFGMGNYFRGQTEHIAFGVKGSQMLTVKDASTLLPSWKRGESHSSKPVEIYEFLERCSPGPYLEMFSRSQRDGWFAWGEDS